MAGKKTSKQWKDHDERDPVHDRKGRRCNFFDDNSVPRRLQDGTLGCSRSSRSCRFAHPSDPEWATALSCWPPADHLVSDKVSDFYYSLVVSSERRHSSTSVDSFARRRDSFESSTSRDRYPPSNISMRYYNRRRSGSPSGSTISDHKNDGARKAHRDEEDALHRLQIGERPLTLAACTPSSSSCKPEMLDTTSANRPNQSIMQPPPPPSLPLPEAPSVPPPPLPKQPPEPPNIAFNSIFKPKWSKIGEGKKELSVEEKRAIWSDRVDLMFASVKARAEYSTVEKQLKLFRRMGQTNSGLIPRNEKLASCITRLQSECEAKRKEMSEVMERLMASDFWPALKQPEVKDLEYKYSEVCKEVSSMTTSVSDMYAGVMKLYEKLYKKEEVLKEVKTEVATSGADDPSRPRKRRRLDDGDVDSLEKDEETGDTELLAELEAIRDELLKVRGRLGEVENDIYQRDIDINDEIDSRISVKMEELELAFSSEQDTTKAEHDAALIAQQAFIQCIEQNITSTGGQVAELAKEVANLMLHSNDIETENTRLRVENKELREKDAEMQAEIAQISEGLQQYPEILEKNRKNQEVLNAALQAFMAHPVSPPPPSPPSPEYLAQAIEDSVVLSIRTHIQPLFVQLREEIALVMQQKNGEVYDALWPNLKLTLRMIDTIQNRIGLASAESAPNLQSN